MTEAPWDLRDRGETGGTDGGGFRIFINYRRSDTAGHAGRLWDALVGRFDQDRIFMDIDTIPAGVDFVDVITDALGSSAVVIALIGRYWLTATDSEGRRRLDDPDDSVRLELETALARKSRIIPTLVQGVEMPSADNLPESLRPLARRNAVELSDSRWRYDVARLVGTLEKLEREVALREELEREAAERAERDRLEREAAELAARQRAEQEAADRRIREQVRREAARQAAQERAQRKAAEDAERKRREAAAPVSGTAGPRAAGLQEPVHPPRRRAWKHARYSVVTLLTALAAAGAASGFAAGRTTKHTANTFVPPRPAVLVPHAEGALHLRAPRDWKLAHFDPIVPGIEFRQPLYLAPSGHLGQVGIVVGSTAAAPPSLLPKPFLALLPGGRPPSRTVVRLGKVQAFRYETSRVSGFHGTLVVYVVATPAAETIACFAEGTGGQAFLSTCEGIAATAQISRARLIAVLPSKEYATALNGALAKARAATTRSLVTLREAKTQKKQAAAASAIAATYRAAAEAIERISVPAFVRDAATRVPAATRAVGTAYGALAAAARRAQPRAFAAATQSVERAERTLHEALAALAAYGYVIR